MAIRNILLLGNPDLYKKSDVVLQSELSMLNEVVCDLHDTLTDFRNRNNAGRAIAAPQIGVHKKVIYMNIIEPITIINPSLEPLGTDTIELWDDCMSFPDLLVKVKRFKRCQLTYKDLSWRTRELILNDDLSELIQHEYDHLEGILAVQRAIDQFSFSLKSQVKTSINLTPDNRSEQIA